MKRNVGKVINCQDLSHSCAPSGSRSREGMEDQLGSDERTEPAQALLDELCSRYVAPNRSLFFTLTRKSWRRPRVQTLWDRRLLHAYAGKRYDL
jgi:hypothetical protein